jgi:thiol:disulfide interchange protein DsbD
MQLSGSVFDYVFVFLWGIALSFTPCVYPLIPVTAGYIGINSGPSTFKGLFLSLVYVIGLSVTYSALGIIAVLTGKMFGSINSHPAVLIAAGAIFILFGLSMLKVFVLYLPAVVKMSHFKIKGYFSVFFLGLVSGLIASPCVSPALGSILVYLGTTRNIIYGGSLLFVFAFGMGLTLILAGTFSAILINFPKSGKWMLYVEKICACVLIGLGVYFIITGIRRI